MSNGNQEIVEWKGMVKPAHSLEKVVKENKVVAEYLANTVIEKNEKLEFNGKRHITFDEWQTLGNAYDVKVETRILEFIDAKPDFGWKAEGEAIHIPSGNRVGYAQATCFRSEKGRGGQNKNQIASMAQTRAGSKALRNALGWVVKLAGLSTTPFEEMDGIKQNKAKEDKERNDLAHMAETENKKEEKEVKEDANVVDAEFEVKDKKGKDTKDGTTKTKGRTGGKTEGKSVNRPNTKGTKTEKKEVKTGVHENVTDNKNAEKLKKEREKQEITKEDVKKEMEDKHEKPYDTEEKQATFKKPDLSKMDGQELVAHIRNGIHTGGEVATEGAIKRTLTKLFKNKTIRIEQRREALAYLKENS